MLLGVISDTHGLLRPRAVEILRGTDAILHAGDVGNAATLAALRVVGPPVLAVVRGNVDHGAWADDLPERVTVEVAGRRVLVLHDRLALDLYPAPTGTALVVSGHSHRPAWERQGNGVLFLNPGAAGPKRFRLPVCLALVRLEGDQNRVRARFVDIVGEN